MCISASFPALPSWSSNSLGSFSSLTYNFTLVLSFRTSFTISQTCKGMGWWRSLMPKETMPGRCILMRQPKRSWTNLQCAMASNQYTRPWRKMHSVLSLVQTSTVTHWCDWFRRLSVLIIEGINSYSLWGVLWKGRLHVSESLISSKSGNYCLTKCWN